MGLLNEDTNKLSEEELKASYWFVTHKLLLRRLGIFVLGLVDLFLIIYSGYILLNVYIFKQPAEVALQRELTTDTLNYQALAEISAPTPLTISYAQNLASDGTTDFVAEVVNPNASWYASQLSYHFESGETKTPVQTTYFLPSETRYLLALGVKSENVGGAALVIDEIKWQKVAYYDALKEKFLQFEVVDPKFVPAVATFGAGGVLNRVDFEVVNNSAYNFWDVNLKVLMFQGGSLVGVNSVPVRTFNSGEKKFLSFNVYNGMPTPSQVVVYPEVDILNSDSFKGFE